jgi:hypothetical protein
MITVRNQKFDEERIFYLMLVLKEFMDGIAGNEKIFYDGAEYDGACLLEDFANELNIDLFYLS